MSEYRSIVVLNFENSIFNQLEELFFLSTILQQNGNKLIESSSIFETRLTSLTSNRTLSRLLGFNFTTLKSTSN